MKRGRPPIARNILARVLERRRMGLGYGRIARGLGIGKTRGLRACQKSQVRAGGAKT